MTSGCLCLLYTLGNNFARISWVVTVLTFTEEVLDAIKREENQDDLAIFSLAISIGFSLQWTATTAAATNQLAFVRWIKGLSIQLARSFL